MWRIPIQLTPEVKTPTISVSVVWPGASPYEIEHEIVQQLEDQLNDVKGVTRMTSCSSYSHGSVTMEFPVGTDITQSMLGLNSRINQLRDFPVDAFEAGSRPEDIAQAKARLAAARDASEFADTRLQRVQELIRQDASSSEQLELQPEVWKDATKSSSRGAATGAEYDQDICCCSALFQSLTFARRLPQPVFS